MKRKREGTESSWALSVSFLEVEPGGPGEEKTCEGDSGRAGAERGPESLPPFEGGSGKIHLQRQMVRLIQGWRAEWIVCA